MAFPVIFLELDKSLTVEVRWPPHLGRKSNPHFWNHVTSVSQTPRIGVPVLELIDGSSQYLEGAMGGDSSDDVD